jgi:hypothetical protein
MKKILLSLSDAVADQLNKEPNKSALVDVFLAAHYGLTLNTDGASGRAREAVAAGIGVPETTVPATEAQPVNPEPVVSHVPITDNTPDPEPVPVYIEEEPSAAPVEPTPAANDAEWIEPAIQPLVTETEIAPTPEPTPEPVPTAEVPPAPAPEPVVEPVATPEPAPAPVAAEIPAPAPEPSANLDDGAVPPGSYCLTCGNQKLGPICLHCL